MTRSEAALRWAGVGLAVSVSAALSAAWAMTTRTTAVDPGMVYRENLWTGHGEYCVPFTRDALVNEPTGRVLFPTGGCQPSASIPRQTPGAFDPNRPFTKAP